MPKSLLRTETVRYGEAEVVVETMTLLSQMERDDLYDRLKEKVKRGAGYLQGYADVVCHTRKYKNLGFELPAPEADDDTHLAAFAVYVTLPTLFVNDCMSGIMRVSIAPNPKAGLAAGAASDSPKASAQDASDSAA